MLFRQCFKCDYQICGMRVYFEKNILIFIENASGKIHICNISKSFQHTFAIPNKTNNLNLDCFNSRIKICDELLFGVSLSNTSLSLYKKKSTQNEFSFFHQLVGKKRISSFDIVKFNVMIIFNSLIVLEYLLFGHFGYQ